MWARRYSGLHAAGTRVAMNNPQGSQHLRTFVQPNSPFSCRLRARHTSGIFRTVHAPCRTCTPSPCHCHWAVRVPLGTPLWVQLGGKKGRKEGWERARISNRHTTGIIPTPLVNAACGRSRSTRAGVRHKGGLHLPAAQPPQGCSRQHFAQPPGTGPTGGPACPQADPHKFWEPWSQGGSVSHAPERAISSRACSALRRRRSPQPAWGQLNRRLQSTQAPSRVYRPWYIFIPSG